MFVQKGITWLVSVLFAAILLLSGCSDNGSPEKSAIIEHNTIIDWTDFLKLNAISYTGSWQAALTDPSKLGEEIGKVAFQVADHVDDPHYITKNGDAAFLAIGTVVRAITDYPNHEIVAVQDAHSLGGYKIYVEDGKQKELGLTFEKAVQNKITQVSLYPTDSYEKPIFELKNGRQLFLLNLMQTASQEQSIHAKTTLVNPVYYRLLMNSGAAIGYVDTIYKDVNLYYWDHPEANLLPSAFAYYFANERDVVFEIKGMSFPLPNHVDTIMTGERIKRDGSINNITLISSGGDVESSLFTEETIDQLWEKARKINPSSGEDKASLFMADRAMPVNNGQLIAYATNKDTVVKQGIGSVNVNLIHLDGTGDRMLVDGSKYGGYIRLLDSLDDRIIAEGADRSLLDISISTGEVLHYPINGMLDALSLDGQYVLYRKMIGDSMVGNEIAAFDLRSHKSIDLGQADRSYVFNQGVK